MALTSHFALDRQARGGQGTNILDKRKTPLPGGTGLEPTWGVSPNLSEMVKIKTKN